MSHSIGTLNEKPLHAALKQWYAEPGDQLEVPVDGYHVDIVRDGLLIEIQTGSFSSIQRKLRALTRTHPVRLVYPVARERWLVKEDGSAAPSRRKSPKRGRLEDLFEQLVSFPDLLQCPRFAVEVLLVQEEELRRFDGKRARRRRRGWLTQERRLLAVVEQHRFDTPMDLAALVPAGLGQPFLTSDLAAALGCPRWLAQKMAYCLRQMGAIEAVGKQGNAIAYARGAVRRHA